MDNIHPGVRALLELQLDGSDEVKLLPRHIFLLILIRLDADRWRKVRTNRIVEVLKIPATQVTVYARKLTRMGLLDSAPVKGHVPKGQSRMTYSLTEEGYKLTDKMMIKPGKGAAK